MRGIIMDNEKLIYIADDEPHIRDLIRSFLEKDDYAVEAFETGDDLFKAFNKKKCDLVILDISDLIEARIAHMRY